MYSSRAFGRDAIAPFGTFIIVETAVEIFLIPWFAAFEATARRGNTQGAGQHRRLA